MDPLKKLWTTHEIAVMTQFDASTISKWIDQGKLIAFRTPGGHRRIRGVDLVEFLRKYEMPLPEEFDQAAIAALATAAAPAKKAKR